MRPRPKSNVRPLVFIARGAAEDARKLIGGPVPENVIADAIVQGHVQAGRVGHVRDPDGRWVAHIERRPGRLRKRPLAWFVAAVTRPRRDTDVDHPPS